MTLQINIGEAKTRLSELIARVEAGEEVVIARDNKAVAKLSRVRHPDDVKALIEDLIAAQKKRAPTTIEEILLWRDEDRSL